MAGLVPVRSFEKETNSRRFTFPTGNEPQPQNPHLSTITFRVRSRLPLTALSFSYEKMDEVSYSRRYSTFLSTCSGWMFCFIWSRCCLSNPLKRFNPSAFSQVAESSWFHRFRFLVSPGVWKVCRVLETPPCHHHPQDLSSVSMTVLGSKPGRFIWNSLVM